MKSVRGFTLMEVLVAMVLLSLFAVVSYRALDAVLNTQRDAIERMNNLNELAAAFALMDRDLSNITTPSGPRDPGGNGFHTMLEQDGAGQFDLVRMLPEDADQGLQRIGYRCAGETLSRQVWPDVYNPANPPNEFRLLGGLRSCAFKYLDAEGQWQNAWQAQGASLLPRAVELSITEADGVSIRRVLRVQ
jgi:general secretion pathway protein J